MPTTKKFTFDVPPDLRAVLDDHPEVNWTAVFRDAIRRQAVAADLARRIVEEQSDPRIAAVTASVKSRVGKRFRDAPASKGRRAAA